MSINRCILSGNLTRDAELRQTGSGLQVLRFSIAVNNRVRDRQTGEWKDRPDFVDCCVMGNRAQGLSPHLVKGTKVALEGRLRYSSWEKDGSKRSKLELIVSEIDWMSPSKGNAQPAPAPQAQTPAAAPQATQPFRDDNPGYYPDGDYRFGPQDFEEVAPLYDEDIDF